MESIRIYKCGKSIVSISSTEKYIIRSEGAFYYPTKDVFESCFDVHEMKLERIVRDNILLPIGMILIIMVSLAYYFNSAKYVIVDNNFALSTVMLLVNIPLHEIGHVLMLKKLYPECKIKVGFKFVFIYPAVYVDTSFSYLLPKYKRIAVYMAGNTMNAIFVILIGIFFPFYNKYLYLIVDNILINFIPIVKSDGYYSVMALFNRYTVEKSMKKNMVDSFVRGLIMFFVMLLLSYV